MALVYLFGFAAVCYGWGWLVAAYACPRSRLPVAYQIALGMAGLNFAGGLLNALHGARAGALCGLAMVGIAAIAVGGFLTVRQGGGIRRWWLEARAGAGRNLAAETCLGVWFPPAVVAIIILFLAANLIPASAFNIGDDFHTYLVRPVRMLATGTIGGDPFDCLGLDSLGSQSFFHAFVLVDGPFSYLNGFDAVFCFGILAFVLLDINRELKLHWGFGLLAVLTMGFINPQQVNISSLYSGSLMLGGLFLASWHLVNGLNSPGSGRAWSNSLPVALFLATLVTLKTTLALFACAWAILFFGLLIMAGDSWKKMAKLSLTSVAAAAAAVFPWLAISLPDYVEAHRIAAPFFGVPSLAVKYPSMVAHDFTDLFTNRVLFYGGRQQDYNLIVSLMLGMGLVSLGCWMRGKNPTERARLGLLGAFSLTSVGLYFLNVDLFAVDTGIRYSCPILIGVFPVTALAWVRHFSPAAESKMRAPGFPVPAWLPAAVIPLLQFVVLCLFLPVVVSRVDIASRTRTLLSYPLNDFISRYNYFVFSGPAGDETRKLQARVEPKATVLVWTSLPFQFDFTRNRIFSVSEPGIINPWLRFPAGVPEQMLLEYLRSWGIRMVVLEHSGPTITTLAGLQAMLQAKAVVYRKLADYSIYTRQTLASLARKNRILYEDERFMVFEINDRPVSSTRP
jgi:hypothetical protein